MGIHNKKTNRELLELYFDTAAQLVEVQKDLDVIIQEFQERGIAQIDLTAPKIFVGNNGKGSLVSEDTEAEVAWKELQDARKHRSKKTLKNGKNGQPTFRGRGDISKNIYDLLSSGRATGKELAATLELTPKQVSNSLSLLKRRGLVEKTPGFDRVWQVTE